MFLFSKDLSNSASENFFMDYEEGSPSNNFQSNDIMFMQNLPEEAPGKILA